MKANAGCRTTSEICLSPAIYMYHAAQVIPTWPYTAMANKDNMPSLLLERVSKWPRRTAHPSSRISTRTLLSKSHGITVTAALNSGLELEKKASKFAPSLIALVLVIQLLVCGK